MRKKIIGIQFIILFCGLTLIGGRAQCQTTKPAAKSFTSSIAKPVDPEVVQLWRDIAEMLLVGFRGMEVSDTMHIVRDIQRLGIGGVILFEYDTPTRKHVRNIQSSSQLQKLCTDLQALSDETLLIGIDQEGGNVSRLKAKYGFPPFASAQASAKEGLAAVRRNARLTAQTLRKLGINLNFAPCVDVNVNPACPIIGKLERSFSSDPDMVARCAAIWLEEQQKAGVIGCLKHFPGHGSSLDDTHLGLADVSETWKELEIKPYRQLIAAAVAHPEKREQQVEMVMTTHVFNSHLDSIYPATLSYATLTKLLRKELGYKGVIITDDLAMGAMTQQYSYEEMLRLTLNAGADMLCLSNNGKEYNPNIVPETIALIIKLIQNGQVPEQRIHESAARIRAMKKRLAE